MKFEAQLPAESSLLSYLSAMCFQTKQKPTFRSLQNMMLQLAHAQILISSVAKTQSQGTGFLNDLLKATCGAEVTESSIN